MHTSINHVTYHLPHISDTDVEMCPRVKLKAVQEMSVFLACFFAKKVKQKSQHLWFTPALIPSFSQSKIGPRACYGSPEVDSSSLSTATQFFVPYNNPGRKPLLEATDQDKEKHAKIRKILMSNIFVDVEKSSLWYYGGCIDNLWCKVQNHNIWWLSGYPSRQMHKRCTSSYRQAKESVAKEGLHIHGWRIDHGRGWTLINVLVASIGALHFLI